MLCNGNAFSAAFRLLFNQCNDGEPHMFLFVSSAASSASLISMNLHQEMQLSDANGSTVVSSHYVAGAMTTLPLQEPDTVIR